MQALTPHARLWVGRALVPYTTYAAAPAASACRCVQCCVHKQQVCDLQPGEFVHTCGDAHVYANHVEPLKQQLLNTPRHFPRLVLNPARKSIDEFVFEDFELQGYSCHKTIKMQMAV